MSESSTEKSSTAQWSREWKKYQNMKFKSLNLFHSHIIKHTLVWRFMKHKVLKIGQCVAKKIIFDIVVSSNVKWLEIFIFRYILLQLMGDFQSLYLQKLFWKYISQINSKLKATSCPSFYQRVCSKSYPKRVIYGHSYFCWYNRYFFNVFSNRSISMPLKN